MKVKVEMDYRYANTLRINFDVPVGLGSCDYTRDEITNEIANAMGNRTLKEWGIVTAEVNCIIRNTLGSDVVIDWRDANEVEVHGIIKNLFECLGKYFESK